MVSREGVGNRRLTDVDTLVGENARRHRKIRGLTQQALAVRVNLGFEQIRRTEFGANRVSASMLYMLASALDVQIQAFFEGLEHQALPLL